MTDHPVPDSLRDPGLAPVWEAVRRHLDRFGTERRGTIARPDLGPSSTLTLRSLLGRRPPNRLDLAELERALAGLKISEDLSGALARLGHPPSESAATRRAARERSRASRVALEGAIRSWEEPWARRWAKEVASSGLLGGLDGAAVEVLVTDVRRLLDHLDHMKPSTVSRTELAFELYGSTHALDEGTKRAAAVTQVLRHREQGFQLAGRALWEAAGILANRVSAPVLAWSLPVLGESALDEQIRSASAGGLPVHISLLALQEYPVTVPRDSPVLVVENPRLVEAAVERRLPSCVITTHGNPSTAVKALLRQLRESGASIWYHGDFDAAGIEMCRRRMYEDGATPWMMDARDYEAALDRAEQAGIRLVQDSKDCGDTPWDPDLRAAFQRRDQRIIHEEFVLDSVLDQFAT